ncbi:putative nucleotidyltransferase, ribonuclease H [Tanacetum coccineum]
MAPRRNRMNNEADLAFTVVVAQAVVNLLPTLTARKTDKIHQNRNNRNNVNRRNVRRVNTGGSAYTPVEAENWIAHIEKIFEVLGCDDQFKARLATYKLEGDAHNWGVRRFGLKGKLSPRFIGPFEILDRIGEVSYRLALPPQLSHVHNVFHVSLLRGYNYHPYHVVQYPFDKIREDLSFAEEPEAILDRQERVMRKKTIPLVKVLWKNHPAREATWENQEMMRNDYLHFFSQFGSVWMHPRSAQAQEITSLKKRFKKLEKKGGSRTHKLKRLYRVGRSARVVSSEEESLGDQEDASKQGRIDDIDADKDIYLVNVHRDEDLCGVNDLEGDEAQAHAALKSAKVQEKGDVIKEPSVPVSAASTKQEQEQEQEQALTPIVSSQQPTQFKDKGKGIMVEEEHVKKMSRKELLKLDEELAFKQQAEEDEEERLAREKA